MAARSRRTFEAAPGSLYSDEKLVAQKLAIVEKDLVVRGHRRGPPGRIEHDWPEAPRSSSPGRRRSR
jgi:hypothetical protein